jgi:hypothetical protein
MRTNAPIERWPKPLGADAYTGVLGDMVKAIAPETEADPAAILVQMLIMFGNCIGRTPKFRVGADVHHVNLFGVIVGATAKGRKGMSESQAEHVFELVDDDWRRDCIKTGLSTGEGLIWTIRDEIRNPHPVKEKGRIVGTEDAIDDPGVKDKRLLVVESEFAKALKVIDRDGNTLSPILRSAWDSDDTKPLRTMTKTSNAKATAPHVSIIGHITSDELRRALTVTEMSNGFGNRFLWVLAKRSKELPHGGKQVSVEQLAPKLTRAVAAARASATLTRDKAANQLWESIYSTLSADRPGLLGAMTARAEAQTLRLSCLYALADGSAVVTPKHLRAALAVWVYAFESAAILFGDRLGDPVADAILAYLRNVWPESVTRTEIYSDLFQRNRSAADINRSLALLQTHRLAAVERDHSGDGRPVDRWRYLENAINELDAISLFAEVLKDSDAGDVTH